MIGRILAAALVAVIIASVIMAVVTALYPKSLLLVEPLVCEDWQTMEVSTRSVGRGESTIDAVCTGDGEVLVLGRSLLWMFAAYFTPFFLLFWLRGYTRSRMIKLGKIQPVVPSTFTVSPQSPSHIQSVTVTTTSADPQTMQETLKLVQDALSDGVITPDEFEQIKAKAESAAEADTGSLAKRLTGLRHSYEQGLITEEEYEKKRSEMIEEF